MKKQEKIEQQPKQPMNKSKKFKKLSGPVATIFSSVDTGSWRITRPAVDLLCCTACGQCQAFCPADVIEIITSETGTPQAPGKKQVRIEIDWNYCKGCGICADVCPRQCIGMVSEDDEKK